MKLKGNITISRSSNNLITVSIEDDLSGIRFVTAEVSLADFSMALTGLGHTRAELRVDGLQYVGKQKERVAREIICPVKSYDREALTRWLIENGQEDGWILDSYIGSQRSIEPMPDNRTKLHYALVRYVDTNP